MDRHGVGARGEALAAAWYCANGYQVLAKNYRTRFGEIDLVLEQDGCLIFCEVKTRSKRAPGTAALAVTKQKQKRIIKAVQGFLMQNRISDPLIRFDVAEVYYDCQSADVNVIENAFTV